MDRTVIRIGEIADIGRGSSPRPITDKKYFENGDIPWVKIADATASGKYIYETKEYVNELGASYSRVMKPGALILSASGVSLGIPYFLGVEGCIHDGWIYMDNIHDINKQYLYYLLLTMRPYFDNLSYGAAIQNINTPILSRTKIEIPDIKIQEKIADILSNLDSLIENNTKRIKLLEQMAENLYKEWFVRFRFPGHENVELENGLPKGWKYTTVEELSEVLQRGISPQYDDEGKYTVISQKCIRTNVMDISEARRQAKSYKEYLNLQDADTVICSTGTGTLGRVGKVIGDYPNTTFDSHVTLVRAKDSISKQYLYGAIKNIQIWLMNMGIGSTNQQELYRSTIKNAKIILPEDKVMKQFEEISKLIHDEIGTLILSRDNLIKQRNLLLPRLMSGKLEVK